jgi:hypothetical protein
MRPAASGTAGALKATTWGNTMAWVSAWGRSQAPPRTWQILWCSPEPVVAKATPAR